MSYKEQITQERCPIVPARGTPSARVVMQLVDDAGPDSFPVTAPSDASAAGSTSPGQGDRDGPHPAPFLALTPEIDAAVMFGDGEIDTVHGLLRSVGTPEDAPLTALAVEVFGNFSVRQPVGPDLGFARILRVWPPASVPEAC